MAGFKLQIVEGAAVGVETRGWLHQRPADPPISANGVRVVAGAPATVVDGAPVGQVFYKFFFTLPAGVTSFKLQAFTLDDSPLAELIEVKAGGGGRTYAFRVRP